MLVVRGNSKVIRSKAFSHSSWTNYRWSQGMDCLKLHSNFKTMNSGLKMFLGLKKKKKDDLCYFMGNRTVGILLALVLMKADI